MQVIGGEIGTEIGAVPIDRTVLHQSIGEEQFLPVADVFACEQRVAPLGDDFRWNRRVLLINADREIPQDGKADEKRQHHGLHPAG